MSLFFSFNKEKSLKAAEKYTQQGKVEAAIKEYERILEVDPADLNVCVSIAGLYAQVKRNKDAAAKYLKVADQYRKKGNLPQATALYRKANRLDPADYSVALVLADLLNKQGLTSDALQIYVNASHACKNGGHYVNAVKVLREAVKLNPDNPYLKMELAEALFGIDSIDEAHDIYVTVGREFYHKAQLAEGLQAFQKALVVKPGSKPALKALTDFSLQHGDRQGAVAMLQELLENTPNDVDLIVLLGRTCLQARMYPEAEEAFLRLLELDPQRYEYLLEVARGYVNSGEYNRAVVLIGKCLDLIVARRHKKRATAILKNIVSQDPHNLMALNTLADIYERVGEKRNLTTTLNTVVEVALEQGLNQQARIALERLIGLTPGKKTYRIQLAQIGPITGELPTGAHQTVELDDDVNLTEKVESSADYSTELLEDMLAKNPELAQARIKLIEDMVAQQPDFIEARQQLKQRYIESGLAENAALECLEIARLYETRDNYAAAEEIRQEAYFLNPYLNPVVQTKLMTGRFDVSFLQSLESGEMLADDSPMDETTEFASARPTDDDVIELNVTDFLQSPVEFSQGGAKIVDSTASTLFEVPGTMEPVSAKPSNQTGKAHAEHSSNAMVFEIPRTPEPQMTSSIPEAVEVPESPPPVPEPAFESWDSVEAQQYAQDFLAQAYQMYQQAESPAIPEMSEIPAIPNAVVAEPPPWETGQGSGFESQGSGFRVPGSGVAEPVAEDTLPEPQIPLDEEPPRKFSTARLFAISASGGELFTGPLVDPGESQGSGFRVPGSGFESQGSGFRVPGSGFPEPEIEPETQVTAEEVVSTQFDEVSETEESPVEDAGFAVVGEVTTFENQGSGFRVPGSGFTETEIEPETPIAIEEIGSADFEKISEEPVWEDAGFAVVGEVTTFENQGSGFRVPGSGFTETEIEPETSSLGEAIESHGSKAVELDVEPETPALVEEETEPVAAELIEPVSEDVESQALQYELMHQEDSGQVNEDLISREIEVSRLIENQFGEVLDTEIEPVFEADDLSAPSLEPLVADLMPEDSPEEAVTDSASELEDAESQALQYELIQEDVVDPDDYLISREIEISAVLENQFGEVLDTEIEPTLETNDLSVPSLEPLVDGLVSETELSQEEIELQSESEEPEFEEPAQIEMIETEPGTQNPEPGFEEPAQVEMIETEPGTRNPEPGFEELVSETELSQEEIELQSESEEPEFEEPAQVEMIETEPGTQNPEPGFEAVNPSPIPSPPSPLPEFSRFSETLKIEPVQPVEAPIEEGLSAIESILQRGKTAKLKPIVSAEGVYGEYVHRIQTEQGDISEAVRAVTAPLTMTVQSSQWAEEVTPASESVATGALGRTSEVNVSALPSAISSETRSATHVSSMSWEASHPVNPLHESRLSPEPQPVWTVSFDELESGSLKPADMKEELAGKVAELMTAQELNKTLLAHWNNRFTQVEVSFIKLVVDPFVKYGTAVTPELSKAILSPVADMIETECRTEPKLIAYCGSAEFFIVLPGVTSGEIAEIAEHLRSQAESLWLSMPNRESDEWLTVSLGVVTSFPLKSSLDSLLSAVNLALELAKDAGGNRVMISPSPLD